MDCGFDTSGAGGACEYYSLHDEIWWQAVTRGDEKAYYELVALRAALDAFGVITERRQEIGYAILSEKYLGLSGGMLCVGCLEDRLGRRLVPEDFTDAPLNAGSFMPHTERLRSRIEGRKERP